MKIDWQQLALDSLGTGALASLATAATAAICGRRDGGSAIAPINAISHIAWGSEAAQQEKPSIKYTATGVGLNTAATIGWAGIYHLLFARDERRDPLTAVVGGAAVSALAYVTDYHVVPRRLTPGFEMRLSNRSMWQVYSMLAAALAAGGLLAGSDDRGSMRW